MPVKHYFFCFGHINLQFIVFSSFKYISQFFGYIWRHHSNGQVHLYNWLWSNLNMVIESPFVTAYLYAIVMLAPYVCHHFRDIRSQNVLDFEFDLGNGLKLFVNKWIERPYPCLFPIAMFSLSFTVCEIFTWSDKVQDHCDDSQHPSVRRTGIPRITPSRQGLSEITEIIRQVTLSCS